jgi:subtilisin family serine protease
MLRGLGIGSLSRRSAIGAMLAACLLPSAAGAAIGPKHRELSPDLARLAAPALRAKSAARQSALLGIPQSGPGSLLREGRRVLVNLRFAGGAVSRLPALRRIGAKVISASRRYQTATVAAVPAKLRQLTAVPGVRAIWPNRAPVTYAEGNCEGGSVITEGLEQLRVGEARQAFGLRGKGETVGVLSDSFDNAAEAADESGPVATHAHQDILSGDLPGQAGGCSGQQLPVRVLADGPGGTGEDEGRAMLQIVHDLAPHASLAFATAFESEVAFAQNIEKLAKPVPAGGAGADVIVDDVAWFEEPFFQDGPVATAINKVTSEGVVYLTAAGNDNLFENEVETVQGEAGIASWEAPAFRDSGGCPPSVVALSEALEEQEVKEGKAPIGLHPSHCMDFQPGAPEDATFGITVNPGATLTVDLQWAEPWGEINTDLDALLLGPGGNVLEASLEGNTGKSGTQRPFELIQWKNEFGSARTVNLVINRFSGGEPRLKFGILENGSGVSSTEYPESLEEDVVGPTVFGHAGAASAITLGAVPFGDSSRPERYSSRGPVTHYFAPVEGMTPAAPLGSPEELVKPNLVATDCGVTTFFAQLEGPSWRFCGTSAAAPHAAAVAALLRQGDPTATPAQIREALTESAAPIAGFGEDAVGAGLLDALGAVEKLPPSGPVDDPPSTVVPPTETEAPPPKPVPLPETPVSQAPSTSISRHPPKRVRTRRRNARVAFGFASDQPGVAFLCQVDGGRLFVCGPSLVRTLAVGPHTVQVQARNTSGQTDSTPAVYRFRIQRIG